MHNRTKLSMNTEKGLTLIELMISLSIGLVLFAGVLSVFVGMRSTTAETSTYGELQENGRFAISVLTDDLLRQDFWGDYAGRFSTSNLISIPAVGSVGNDCIGGGVNNATFPLAVGHFRTIWGQTLTAVAPNPLGCFVTPVNTRTRPNSDVIQLKRVLGTPNLVPAAATFYLRTNHTTGGIFRGNALPVINNTRTWEYQHHVYYVRDDIVGNNFVPVLMQGRLANGNMVFDPIVDGIEVIRFMYGIDTNGDGVINSYISASGGNMTDALWNNAGGSRILAVKVYVLARSIEPDMKYTNTNSYQLGDLAIAPVNDNFRRLLFSSTITLYNAR